MRLVDGPKQAAEPVAVTAADSALFRISLASGGGDEGLQFLHQLREAFESDLLRTVAPGFGGVRMHFDEQRVRAHRDGAFAYGGDEVRVAREVTLELLQQLPVVKLIFDERCVGIGSNRSYATNQPESAAMYELQRCDNVHVIPATLSSGHPLKPRAEHNWALPRSVSS